jgi:microcystin-dependent protein
MDPAPAEFSAQSPNLFSTLANLVADLLSGTMDVSLMLGQVGGPQPVVDIGPWLNQNGVWWFFDKQQGTYAPTQQGCPIGTVAMWGSKTKTPKNWLICVGQALSATQYPLLFNVIRYTWGGSGNTFYLPPSGRFYVSAAAYQAGKVGFIPDPAVPLDLGSPTYGLNVRGGSMISQPLAASNLPTLKVSIPFTDPDATDGPGGVNATNFQAPETADHLYNVYANVSDPLGGATPESFSIMPPFIATSFIIKYL